MSDLFFRIKTSNIDPPALQSRLSTILKKYEVPQHELVAEKLFADIRDRPASKCPFPLVTTHNAAMTQAKKLRSELKGIGISLGRCMRIFAEFWGYHAWQPFIINVKQFEQESDTANQDCGPSNNS